MGRRPASYQPRGNADPAHSAQGGRGRPYVRAERFLRSARRTCSPHIPSGEPPGCQHGYPAAAHRLADLAPDLRCGARRPRPPFASSPPRHRGDHRHRSADMAARPTQARGRAGVYEAYIQCGRTRYRAVERAAGCSSSFVGCKFSFE